MTMDGSAPAADFAGVAELGSAKGAGGLGDLDFASDMGTNTVTLFVPRRALERCDNVKLHKQSPKQFTEKNVESTEKTFAEEKWCREKVEG